LSQEIVELWIDDIDFTIRKHKGRTIGKDSEPLVLTGFTSGNPGNTAVWDEERPGQSVDLDPITGYEPILLSKVGVNRSFSIIQVSKDTNSFCTDNREYDFFTFTMASRFKHLEGLSFIFLMRKDKVQNLPIELIELAERVVDKKRMYLPEYITDFIVDNLRSDYGSSALDKIFHDTVELIKKAFPAEEVIKHLSAEDYEGYRVTLLPGDRKYAVSFKCYKSRSGI
jgi:hypothetical protein